MGFKKDDSGSLPKSSFRNCLVVFLPVSTKRGTVQSVFFLFTPALTEDKQSQVSTIIFLGALSKLTYIKMFF